MKDFLLDIRGLTVQFHTIDGALKVLNRTRLTVRPGEVVGVVGETGSGKSVTAKIVLGILPMPPARVVEGEIFFSGKDLLRLPPRERDAFKSKVAYIPQDPMTSLNPVFSVGSVLLDALLWREAGRSLPRFLALRGWGAAKRRAREEAAGLLEKVHIPEPKGILRRYPAELSGGMRQRVLLATALIGSPELLIADEPTTALDVTIQKRILELIREKVREERLASLYITHDLGVARSLCDRIYVMYAGTVVESGSSSEMLERPFHPYTRGLIRSIPKLTGEAFDGIPGQVPDYLALPSGCRFHPRCPNVIEACAIVEPPLTEIGPDHSVSCHLYAGRGAGGADA